MYLTVLLTLTTALPLLLFGVNQADTWADRAVRDSDRDLRLRALGLAREIDNHFAVRMRALVDTAAILSVAPAGLDESEMLAAVHARNPEFDFMYVAGADHISRAASPATDANGRSNAGVDYSDRDYVQQLRARLAPSISQVQLGRRSGRPNVQLVAPFFAADGELAGFVEGSVDLTSLVETTAPFVGGAVRALLLDPERRVVADSSGRATVLSSMAGMAPVGSRVEGTIDVRDERGVEIQAVVIPVALFGRDWQVVLARPSEAVAQRSRIAARPVVILTAFVICITALLSLLAAWYFGRQVRQMVGQVRALGSGDFDFERAVPGRLAPREAVQLAQAVEAAADQLRDQAQKVEASLDALSHANERLRPFAEAWSNVDESIHVTDPEGRILYANPAFARLTGAGVDAVVGTDSSLVQTLLALPHEGSTVGAHLAAGHAWRGEHVLSPTRPIDLEVLISPVLDAGVLSDLVVLCRDVTEARKARDALQVSDRLAALGTLAAGVAHEINNPMSYILTNLELSLDSLAQAYERAPCPELAESIEMLGDAKVGGLRVSEIARGLLKLGRGDRGADEIFDPLEVLESCLRLSGADLRARAQLDLDLKPTNNVWGNESTFSQVLINLLINASQSFPAKGPDNRIRVRSRTGVDGAAVIDISDNGAGIPAAIQARIFDPFFTTKPVGEGTGLGLAICHQIITEMRGTLQVHSVVGQGTTMTVTVPRAQSSWVSKPVLMPDFTLGSAVLVVDEVPLIGRMVVDALPRHQVTVRDDVLGAVEALEHTVFDAIFISTTLSSPGSLILLDLILDRWPSAANRVVFTASGVAPGVVEDRLQSLGARRLEKPFDGPTLRAILKAITEAAGRTSAAA